MKDTNMLSNIFLGSVETGDGFRIVILILHGLLWTEGLPGSVDLLKGNEIIPVYFQ